MIFVRASRYTTRCTVDDVHLSLFDVPENKNVSDSEHVCDDEREEAFVHVLR